MLLRLVHNNIEQIAEENHTAHYDYLKISTCHCPVIDQLLIFAPELANYKTNMNLNYRECTVSHITQTHTDYLQLWQK